MTVRLIRVFGSHNDYSVRGERERAGRSDACGRLAAPPSPEHIEALQIICARWLQLTATIVGQDGSIVVRTTEHLERMLPRFSFAANVFIAEMSAFGHAAEPSALRYSPTCWRVFTRSKRRC